MTLFFSVHFSAATLNKCQNGSGWSSQQNSLPQNPLPLSGSSALKSRVTSIDGVSFSEGELLLKVGRRYPINKFTFTTSGSSLAVHHRHRPALHIFSFPGSKRVCDGGDGRGLRVLLVSNHPGLPGLPSGRLPEGCSVGASVCQFSSFS